MYLCISDEEREDQQMEFVTKIEETMEEDKHLSFEEMVQLLHDTDSFYDLEMTLTERHATVGA
jgi:hypothetical protein